MEYEVEVENNTKRNEKYLKDFEKWLKAKGLTEKTIKNHLNNMDLYLNNYLNYYGVKKMEDGISSAYGFLNDWFIRKCLWSSITSIKECAASIKKFYKCMNELGNIDKDSYDFLYNSINDNMDEFISTLIEYDNVDEYW